MDHLDRLTSSYAAMSEGKLAKAASNAYALTDEAQQILREEILTRGLNIELNSRAPQPDIGDEEDGDSGLVVVASLRSRNDAAKIQAVLNAAAVRSCLGSDNVENIESFTGAFDKPVDLKVYFPYAGKASRLIYQLQNSNPPELEKDVEVEDDEADDEDYGEPLVPCPKCHSENIVYSQDFDGDDFGDDDSGREVPEGLREDSTPGWRCNSCGYEWQDEKN